MMSIFQAAWVIARRDFVATVMSRAFVLFLLFPVLIIALSVGFGVMSAKSQKQENRPRVAVVAAEADYAPIAAARSRLAPAFGDFDLAELTRADPDYDVADQAKRLLAAPDKKLVGVLTGNLAHPRLIGALDEKGRIVRQVKAILDEARRQTGLEAAHAVPAPVGLDLVQVEESAGALALERSETARIGQWLLFMVTVMLAGMLLSNFIEEKSNKVIEVLASAIPIDAVFFGKLAAMLTVSLCGLAVWVTSAAVAAHFFLPGPSGLPAPALGWPLFIALCFLYFAMNYLLLGGLFLGIGSQASSVREVQSISMPVTVGQIVIFFVATIASGAFNGPLGIGAALFPFSSPMMMIARAAQTSELWPHAAALLWQALWVWVVIRLGAALFRRNVLKSGGAPTAAFGPRRRLIAGGLFRR
ncbi:MAG: ABC transporter permease [Alphaproteobacteria bacterium]|nr:ABC transporter permease [Alphaproteobacteria bacterium]